MAPAPQHSARKLSHQFSWFLALLCIVSTASVTTAQSNDILFEDPRKSVLAAEEDTLKLSSPLFNQAVTFLLNGEFIRNETFLAKFDGNSWTPINPDLEKIQSGKTVVVFLHGILSNLPTAFAECKTKFTSIDPNNTVLLGFQYDFNNSIIYNSSAFANSLQRLRTTNPQIKVNIVAHSMGTLVAAGAILDQYLDPIFISSFYAIAGMANGTPKANSAADFFGAASNTSLNFRTVLGRAWGISIASQIFDMLPDGISQMGTTNPDFISIHLRGRTNKDIRVTAYGSTTDSLVPIGSVLAWKTYFPQATINIADYGNHQFQCSNLILCDIQKTLGIAGNLCPDISPPAPPTGVSVQ